MRKKLKVKHQKVMVTLKVTKIKKQMRRMTKT